MAGVNGVFAIGHEGRREKRKAVDVIPVGMRQQHRAFFDAVAQKFLAQSAHERLINFNAIERETPKIAEARIAGAKVVQGDMVSSVMQGL